MKNNFLCEGIYIKFQKRCRKMLIPRQGFDSHRVSDHGFQSTTLYHSLEAGPLLYWKCAFEERECLQNLLNTSTGSMKSSSYRVMAWNNVISFTQSRRIHIPKRQLRHPKHIQLCVWLCNTISAGGANWLNALVVDVDSIWLDGLIKTKHNTNTKIKLLAYVCITAYNF